MSTNNDLLESTTMSEHNIENGQLSCQEREQKFYDFQNLLNIFNSTPNLQQEGTTSNSSYSYNSTPDKLSFNKDELKIIQSNGQTSPITQMNELFPNEYKGNSYISHKQILLNLVKQNTFHVVQQIQNPTNKTNFQMILDELNEKEIKKVFNKIYPSIKEIMCSFHGNYFFQKFFQLLNPTQRLVILSTIKNSFVEIASNKYGTHSIQSVCNSLSNLNEYFLLQNIIVQNLPFLVTNENAYHILLEIIITFPEERRAVLNTFLLNNFLKLSASDIGSLIIKKFIEKNKNPQIRNSVISLLRNNFYPMIKTKSSCMVMLYSFYAFGVSECRFITEEVRKNILVFVTDENIPICFLEKAILMMAKNENENFNMFALNIFQNEQIFLFLINRINGIKLLKTIYNNSPIIQQNYSFRLGYLKIKK